MALRPLITLPDSTPVRISCRPCAFQMKVADFSTEFLKHRRKYHERSAKLEKLPGLTKR